MNLFAFALKYNLKLRERYWCAKNPDVTTKICLEVIVLNATIKIRSQ